MSSQPTPRYPVPAGAVRIEEEIRRSRFITSLDRADSVEDARAWIELIREEFSDASHNCWAYLIGPPGSTDRVGMSDDGEPHGTAGRPMLMTLQHSGLGDVVVVVTRYFGGTKLGKGGLVRAYSGGVVSALERVEKSERVETISLSIEFDYGSVTPLQRMLPEFEAVVLDEAYAAGVRYQIQMPVEHLPSFRRAFGDLTRGAGILET